MLILASASPAMIAIACGVYITPSLAAMNRPVLPKPSGRYAVARVSYEFSDASRLEPLSSDPKTFRKTMVHVWYPADRSAREGKPKAPYLPGFEKVKSNLSSAAVADLFRPAVYAGPDSLPATDVVQDAPIAGGRQKFPLLVFCHGWGNPTFLYTAELQDVVSHGYIVAAIDHPYDTAYTIFPDGEVAFFAQERFNRQVAEQPQGSARIPKSA